MKQLHIFKTKPNESTLRIVDFMKDKEEEPTIVSLADKEVNYETLIDQIFSHDKVTSW